MQVVNKQMNNSALPGIMQLGLYQGESGSPLNLVSVIF